MRGVGFGPRISVQPQPVLCGCDGGGETIQSAPSTGAIDVARACREHTGDLLLARAHLGLSRQLPILQLRPMHGHRERYWRGLRDQSPVLVRAPAAQRLSGPILSGSEAMSRQVAVDRLLALGRVGASTPSCICSSLAVEKPSCISACPDWPRATQVVDLALPTDHHSLANAAG